MELIIQQSHLVQTAGTFSLTVIGPHPAVFHRTSLLFKINPITQSLSSDSSICPQTLAKKHDKHTPVTQIHINVCKQKIICHIVLLCCLATDLS